MTDRQLVALVSEAFVLCVLAFLTWASWRGFDPSFCQSVGACSWRSA